MIRRLLLLLLMTATLLVACKGSRDKTPTPAPAGKDTPSQGEPTITSVPVAQAEKTVIRFATYDWEQGRYYDLIETFQEDNPGIEIKLVSIGEILDLDSGQRHWSEDAWARLASSADVIKLQFFDPEPEPGLVRDLTPLIEADATFDLDDFYSGTLTSCQRDGGTWCLPTVAHLHLIAFDKDAFDQAGVPYPEPGWSWDDFLDKARALTQREGDEVSRWGFVQQASLHQPFIENLARPLIDPITDPPTLRFDQPEVIEAVRWYTDLTLEHQVSPYFKPEEAMQRQALVEGGQAAMWDEEYFDWSWLSERRNVGVVPFPGDTRVWAGDKVAMTAGAAHHEAAWRWLKALTQHVKDTYGLRQLPARRSAAEAAGGYWEHADQELSTALRHALEHGYGARWSPFYMGYQLRPGYSAFANAIDAILSGEKSVEDALAEAQAQAKAALLEEAARKAEATPVLPVAVAPPKDESPAGPDAVTIVFSSSSFKSITPHALQPYRDLAEEFQRAHPDIVVEVKLPVGRTMKAVAQDADCFSWAPYFQEPEDLESVLSLEPFLDADLSLNTDDFFPSLLRPFVRQGQLWGLPSQAMPEIIKYNRDLFDAAGVDSPAVDWTTDDFLEVAVALTQGEGEEKQYGFVGSLFDYEFMILLERRGAKLLDTSVDPPTVAFNDPATVEALRWYASLSTDYGVKPVLGADWAEMATSASALFAERQALINGGRAAMWTILERGELLWNPDGLDVGVATIPAGTDSVAGAYNSVEGYFISAHTEAGQACWDWITFLTGQPEAIWEVPARRSVIQSEAYRRKVGDERAAVYEASVAGVDRSPSFFMSGDQPWLVMAWLWLSRAHGQVIAGDASVEEVLEAAQQTFDDYRACVIARDAMFDNEGLQACVLEVDPTMAAWFGL